MRTLGIIGGGIVGKSLLFALAMTERQKYDRVIIFESEAFAPACTFNSTAIVANRGVLPGISPLGDLIHQGIIDFKKHVEAFSPRGVYPIFQVSSAQDKLDMFKRRYSEIHDAPSFRDISFTKVLPLVGEDAFYVNPPEYCDWLYQESAKKMNVTLKKDFVTSISDDLQVKTLGGEEFDFDHLIFACSIKNKLWSRFLKERRVTESKPVIGSYLLFSEIDWGRENYSLNIDGHNLIYRSESHELLIGATSESRETYKLDVSSELKTIYDYFAAILARELPAFNTAHILTGVREKSIKREPYYGTLGNVSYMGGMYKNGFTLSLRIATTLVHQLP